jgi:L-amino acid N-acyltransferase YncA
MIRSAQPSDASRLCEIYNHFVTSSCISFEEIPVTAEEMSQRIETTCAKFPWLVYEHESVIVGYAYASAWRVRSAYRFSAESTVYIAPEFARRGIGNALYTNLLELLRKDGIEIVLGGIALPNTASVALHEKIGFEKVAHLKRVGWKFNQWHDVGYWEIMLNPEINPASR